MEEKRRDVRRQTVKRRKRKTKEEEVVQGEACQRITGSED